MEKEINFKDLTRQEQECLEKEDSKKNCYLDIHALREIGLSEDEILLVSMFYERFIVLKSFVKIESEVLRGCLSALEYLPRQDKCLRKITLESYKSSDNIYDYETGRDGKPEKWSDKFRYEYGHALLYSHKENCFPVLLKILSKVYDWIVKFQQDNNIFEELPKWLQEGMKGNFKDDSLKGSSLYEGDKQDNVLSSNNDKNLKTEEVSSEIKNQDTGKQGKTADIPTEKQASYCSLLCSESGFAREYADKRIRHLTRKECSILIGKLKKGTCMNEVFDFFDKTGADVLAESAELLDENDLINKRRF